MTTGNFSGESGGGITSLFPWSAGDNEITEWEGVEVVLTSHGTEGEAVHAGLIVSALEVQSQPEGLAGAPPASPAGSAVWWSQPLTSSSRSHLSRTRSVKTVRA